jgi:hypothetical protein
MDAIDAIFEFLILAGVAVFFYWLLWKLREWAAREWSARVSSRPGYQRVMTPVHDFFEALGDMVAGFVGCLITIILVAVGLFVLIWIIKRMWEAA